MNRRLLVLPLILVVVALGACLGNSGGPTPPPNNVRTFPGDTMVSVTWDVVDPTISYWMFFAQDPNVTPLDVGTSTLLNAGVVEPAYVPTVLCNSAYRAVLNNDPANDPGFPAFYFTINGRSGTAKGGPGSAPVTGVPRPAGGPAAPWVAGQSFNSSVNGLGYVALTGCGYAGRPPAGMYFAVGPGGAIYSSKLAPTVAGPLTNPGNLQQTWSQGTMPLGFSQNLSAVAGRAAAVNNPAAPGLLVVAVGDGGTVLYSYDGQNWQQTAAVPTTANLHDVAFTGSIFIAVGDSGAVITSGDGVHWTLNTPALSANAGNSTLRAIHCAGGTCIAVGDSGTTLLTGSSGNTWSLNQHGVNNWTMIAFGNNDANHDDVVSYPNGVLALTVANEAINTWVVADADGNYAYLNAATGGAWASGTTPIAPNLVALDYSSRFLALDGAGNAWASVNGSTGQWRAVGTAQVAGNGSSAVGMRSNGYGFVAVGNNGANASSF